MALFKRNNEDPMPPPGAPGGPPKSGLIKRDSVLHTELPAEVPAAPANGGGVRVVGDPTAAKGGGPMAAAPPNATVSASRPQASSNAAAEKTILDRANAEAAALVKDAMEKTEALKKKVQAELQAAIEANNERCQEAFLKAQEDGFNRGRQEALDQAKLEFEGLMNEARNVLQQAMVGREGLIRSATGEIARLALRVAERVIGHEVNINEDVVLHTIQAALEKIKARESVVVRCNPADAEYVRMNKDIFTRMVEGLKQFDVQGDAKVERGGCIIETNLGNVDARIQTQLAVLQLAFGEVERAANENADS
jgi:flagellar assembly protein FliH